MKSILGKIWYSSTNLLRFHYDFGKVHLKLTDIWRNVETFIDSFKFYKTELIHRIILFFLLYNSSLMNYWTLVCLFLDSMHLQVHGPITSEAKRGWLYCMAFFLAYRYWKLKRKRAFWSMRKFWIARLTCSSLEKAAKLLENSSEILDLLGWWIPFSAASSKRKAWIRNVIECIRNLKRGNLLFVLWKGSFLQK